MKYYSGGFTDFIEQVLRGAGEGGLKYFEPKKKPDEKKPDEKPPTSADKVVDAVKSKVDTAVREEKQRVLGKWLLIIGLLYALSKGRR